MTKLGLGPKAKPRTIYDPLEKLSRNARYDIEGKGNMTQIDVDKALKLAKGLREWSTERITKAGYTIPAPTPPTVSATPAAP